jgi:hypothetical protein
VLFRKTCLGDQNPKRPCNYWKEIQNENKTQDHALPEGAANTVGFSFSPLINANIYLVGRVYLSWISLSLWEILRQYNKGHSPQKASACFLVKNCCQVKWFNENSPKESIQRGVSFVLGDILELRQRERSVLSSVGPSEKQKSRCVSQLHSFQQKPKAANL